MSVDVLTVSSKGQVVLPSAMRKNLRIEVGAKLAAYATEDYILLKVLHLPTTEDFMVMLDEAEQWAASVGYTEDDVSSIVKSTRKMRR